MIYLSFKHFYKYTQAFWLMRINKLRLTKLKKFLKKFSSKIAPPLVASLYFRMNAVLTSSCKQRSSLSNLKDGNTKSQVILWSICNSGNAALENMFSQSGRQYSSRQLLLTHKKQFKFCLNESLNHISQHHLFKGKPHTEFQPMERSYPNEMLRYIWDVTARKYVTQKDELFQEQIR